jgi:hypothetical protein
MGNALFAALGLLTIALGMINRKAFILLVVLMAGIPITLMTGNSPYFAALGGMSGQAAWLFAIVIGSFAALIAMIGRLHVVIANTPLFFLFLLLACISLTWADNLLDGVRMVAKFGAPIAFFWVLLAMQPNAGFARRVETALYVTCAISVALAVVNTFSGGVLAPLPLKHGLGGVPALAAPFNSPANFSFLILVGTVTAYCRFLESRRMLYLALFLVFLLAVAMAFVRISIAGALLAIAVVHL